MLLTSSLLLDFIILLIAAVYALHLYISKKLTYWKERGVYSPKTLPIVGHFLDVLLLKVSLGEWLKNYYDKIDKDFFGMYVFDDSYFVVKDPTLIKNILIKDFNHFIDRNIAAPDHSPVTAHMQFLQKSPQWKIGRNKLTAAFTSGKLKAMFPLFISSAHDLTTFLEKNQIVLEAKDLAARFATDIISKCAFGINAYSFEEKDSTFTANRRNVFGFSLRNAFAQTVYFFKPSWVKLLKLEFIQKEAMDYFTEVFMNTMKIRTSNNKRTNDFIDILNDLKQNNEVESDGSDDILFCGAAVQFFLAGFETTSATISFTLYEFAMKPHIQELVRKEIESVVNKYGKVTYEATQEMPYLDMCISETLRMYPVLPFLERKCNKDYPIPNTNFTIEKGTTVLIPMYGLHMDEKYFLEPKKYNPERFITKTDNSNGIHFLPFGEGPRNCLGERFGKLGTKLALVSIIQSFEVSKCPGTPDPIIFEPKSFLLQSSVGLPLKFTKLE